MSRSRCRSGEPARAQARFRQQTVRAAEEVDGGEWAGVVGPVWAAGFVDGRGGGEGLDARSKLILSFLTALAGRAFFAAMSPVAFDTLKLARQLEAAGFPPKQAQDVAGALADTIGDGVVTREYLDLRLGEMRGELDLRLGEIRAAIATKVELAEAKGAILKRMFGAVGVQTLAILGGVAALFRLLG
jgi:hypothetical protein